MVRGNLSVIDFLFTGETILNPLEGWLGKVILAKKQLIVTFSCWILVHMYVGV